MKFFLQAFLSASVFILCQYAKDAAAEDEPKTYQRLIPADVLRDFPGMCFASTKCSTIEIGKSWDLTPFCGMSTCVLSEDKPSRVMELVKDCGPLPLANPKCKLDAEKTNKKAPFPDCCPVFKCEDGAKVEYPEIATAAPEITTHVPPVKATHAPCPEVPKIQRTLNFYL